MSLPDGYNTIVGEAGNNLSGGERQRITIARALLKDSPIVLLDEATAYSDPDNEAEIQKSIDALVKIPPAKVEFETISVAALINNSFY